MVVEDFGESYCIVGPYFVVRSGITTRLVGLVLGGRGLLVGLVWKGGVDAVDAKTNI